MNRIEKRKKVYNKCNGHCAYCGKSIEYKDMQLDHIRPKCQGGTDDINNLNPTCRRCDHYKRSMCLSTFRAMLKTLHLRIRNNYICKVGEDFGIIKVKPWDGVFYFEKHKERVDKPVGM